MATREEMGQALKFYMDKGDTAKAKQIAMAIRNLDRQAKEPTNAPQQQPQQMPQGSAPTAGTQASPEQPVAFEAPSLKQVLLGGAETAATMASGAFGQTIGGLIGLGTLGWTKDPQKATNVINTVADFLTWSPKTTEGQKALATTMVPLEFLDEQVGEVSWLVSGGNPSAATAIKTVLLGGPAIAGAKNTAKGGYQRWKTKREAEKAMRELGINLDPYKIGETTLEAIKRLGVSEDRGIALQRIRDDLIAKKNAAKEKREALYKEAGNIPAYIKTRSLQELADGIERALLQEAWDVDKMPLVKDRLNDLRNSDTHIPGEVNPLPKGVRADSIKLDRLEIIRKRINKMKPAKDDTAQQTALNRLRTEIDNHIRDQFNEDAIRIGNNPDGLDALAVQQKWTDAREAHGRYMRDFKENKVIRDLIENDAGITDMRAWVFGANSMLPKRNTLKVVNKLNEVFGPDSPQMTALRGDALFDLVAPLFPEKGVPNWGLFNTRFERLAKQNKEVAQALGIDMDQLAQLNRAVHAIKTVQPGTLGKFDLARAVAQMAVGHKIARAALRVNIVRLLAGKAFKLDKASKHQMISDITGVDIAAPLFDKRGPRASAIITADFEDEMNNASNR